MTDVDMCKLNVILVYSFVNICYNIEEELMRLVGNSFKHFGIRGVGSNLYSPYSCICKYNSMVFKYN
ncbi:protein of unknown function [Clostridium beijerinckii]|nr:protein of unknown function [Clostridium beijerinckii]